MTRGGAVLTCPVAAHPGGRPPPHPGWRAATVTQVRQETPTARTLVLRVPGWAGHDAGQHVELRLRRPDRSFAAWPPALAPTCYIAGPAAFVDTITRLLTGVGHHPDRLRAEQLGACAGPRRFGGG